MLRGKWVKRNSLLAMAAVLLVSVIAGCSGSNNANKEQNGANAEQGGESVAGSQKFNLWLGWSATVNNDSLVQKYWKEEEPGVEVELEATQGDAVTALNLKLNTGGFEDAAVFNRSEIVKAAMIRSNKVLSVEQYFDMPDKYPNLAAIPKEYLEDMKDADGHIWSIPTWFDQNPDNPWPGWASQSWLVRTDVLEKAGMTVEDLATIEGVEAFLKKAAEQKDESGKPLLPLSFLMDPNDTAGWNDENAVLSTFGVTTGGGIIPAEKKDDQFVLMYDDPQYKAAYQWMNKMYRSNLIDPEVVTDKKERYKEKNKAGRVAMNVGTFFNVDPDIWETLDGPTEPGWFYQVVPFPKVAGVEKLGANTVINPYPGYDVYISKNSKNLDAILKFLDYSLQPKAEQQNVINEGPVGKFWDWVDQPLGLWKYIDAEYEKARNSGEPAQKAKVTPELYMLSSYNNDWYPWWNYGSSDKAGSKKTAEFTAAVGQMGAVRSTETHDLVKAKAGGLIEKYLPELENIRKEYRAKFIMATSDEQFESTWNAFRDALEKRAHWTEVKQEWQEQYEALLNA
ncbi:hypothetical protein [Paenibacillus harenae]|uniref:Extracellular solute-binding protein n=1 Tax=Paenibacillus harenae TaxID=306543 RepID=A0ABT9U2P7_PAEHA|nr:hypothetical protein [Paenibacillus harenae]MDQ0113893.1 hypothetical protein [Paenibacillus harenae]